MNVDICKSQHRTDERVCRIERMLRAQQQAGDNVPEAEGEEDSYNDEHGAGPSDDTDHTLSFGGWNKTQGCSVVWDLFADATSGIRRPPVASSSSRRHGKGPRDDEDDDDFVAEDDEENEEDDEDSA